jgi:hypothetical protein
MSSQQRWIRKFLIIIAVIMGRLFPVFLLVLLAAGCKKSGKRAMEKGKPDS